MVALKRALQFVSLWGSAEACRSSLSTESVQGTSLPLQSIYNVHGGDSLPLGVLSVSDGITDDVLKEDLEDTTSLLVDESGDTLDTTAASQTADGGLGDALDVIAEHLTVTLCASLAESFTSFASSGHDEFFQWNDAENNVVDAFIAESWLFLTSRPPSRLC
jgi:hypothetical protein